MKQQILDYLKKFKIDLKEILESGKTSDEIEISIPQFVKVSYRITYQKQETEIELYYENNFGNFDSFCDGLKKLIMDESDTKISTTRLYFGEWFTWEDKNSGIQIDIKNEDTRFEASFTLKK